MSTSSDQPRFDQTTGQPLGDARGSGGSAGDGDGIPVAMLIRLALAGLLIAAIVIFVLQNLDNVPVSFLSWSFDAPLIVLLAIAAVSGVLLRWIISFWRGRRNK